MASTTYTATEEAFELKLSEPTDPDAIFEYRPPQLPSRAIPIHDEELHAIVGYRDECTAGVYKLYDLDGKLVGMYEKGLESPLLDPIDLIFFFGGIFKALGRGTVTGASRVAAKVAATGAARLTTRGLAAAVVGAMRVAFKGLSVRSLKFTATTAAHMATKARYVPVHLLHLALKYGKRVPDPQKVEGAFLYTINLLKNRERYVLEVVVREKDWTILHFLYKR